MSIKLIKTVLAAIVLISGSVNATVIFQDDFEDGDTLGWSFSGLNSDSWNVGTAASGNQKLQTAETQTPYTYNGTLGLATIDNVAMSQHFKLEADVQVVGSNDRGSDYGHVGFAWGINGQDFNTSYLRTHSNHVTSWSRSPFSGENRLGFAATNSADLDDFSYKMSVEVNFMTEEMVLTIGNVSTTYTGTQFLQINQNTTGSIGLINTGERVSYDNVVLRDFTQVPEPAALGFFGLVLLGLRSLKKR